jgi:hypothetical protein
MPIDSWMSSRRIVTAALAGLALAACVNDGGAGTGQDVGNHTNLNGPLQWAPVVAIGGAISGTITNQQFDLWGIDLHEGDQLTVVETVTDGDLAPEFKLMTANGNVASASFDVASNQLTKTYSMADSGRFFLGVRAYQGNGSGSYSISIECTGGPCSGDPVIAPLLAPSDADACIALARDCAFEDMQVYAGAVGPARARTLFDGCLNKTSTPGGLACASACEGADATAVCEVNIAAIPFYADQSEQCIGELNRCVSECKNYADGNYWYDDGVSDGPDFICTFESLHGSCDGYARDHEWCGGANAHESHAQCNDFCFNAWNAFSDDDYGTCAEECGQPEDYQ